MNGNLTDNDSDDDGIVDGEDITYSLLIRQGDMDSDGKGDAYDIDRDVILYPMLMKKLLAWIQRT